MATSTTTPERSVGGNDRGQRFCVDSDPDDSWMEIADFIYEGNPNFEDLHDTSDLKVPEGKAPNDADSKS